MSRPAILTGRPAFPAGLPLSRPPTPSLERVMERLRPQYEQGVLTKGPLATEFEDRIADLLGVAHAVAVSSCTSGLILAVRALCHGRVVVPSFNFFASAHAVAWNGLEPVFCDVEPETFQADPADIAERIDAFNASALMATHVFGAPSSPAALERLAADAGIPLILDSAHALGARHGGRRIGSFGDVEVFSLAPTKSVIAGEGGIITTQRDDVAEAVRIGRDYGNSGDYDPIFVGLNARFSEFHAALALESLSDLDVRLERRRALAARYNKGFADLPGVVPQAVSEDDESTYALLAAVVAPDEFGLPRDGLMEALAAEGIDSRRYFSPPVHRQQVFARNGFWKLPNTDELSARVISLPLYDTLAFEDVDRVIEVLRSLHQHADEVRHAVRA